MKPTSNPVRLLAEVLAIVATTGTLGKETGPYVVDTLTAPEQNPYKSWLRFTGLDFFPDGRAALCTWSGDVWVVSGINDTLEKLTRSTDPWIHELLHSPRAMGAIHARKSSHGIG